MGSIVWTAWNSKVVLVVELIFAVTVQKCIAMIVGTTVSGVKDVGGDLDIHTFNHPVSYATRSIVSLVLNPMRMVLDYAKVVKHVFVVSAEWRSVKRDLAAEDASNMLPKYYWQKKTVEVENDELREENDELRDQIKVMKNNINELRKENNELKRKWEGLDGGGRVNAALCPLIKNM